MNRIKMKSLRHQGCGALRQQPVLSGQGCQGCCSMMRLPQCAHWRGIARSSGHETKVGTSTAVELVSNFESTGKSGVYDFAQAQFVRDLVSADEASECESNFDAAGAEETEHAHGAAASAQAADSGSCSGDEVQGYRTADRVALLRVPVMSGAIIASYDQGALTSSSSMESVDLGGMQPGTIIMPELPELGSSTQCRVISCVGVDAAAAGPDISVSVLTPPSFTSTSEAASGMASAIGRGQADKIVLLPALAVPAVAGSRRKSKRRSKLMVAKVSHFRCEETGKMDMYKYASTMNEFETFTKFPEAMHHKNLVQVLGLSKLSHSSISVLSEFCDGGDLQQLASNRSAAAQEASLSGSSSSSCSSSDEEEEGCLVQGEQLHAGMSERQVKVIMLDMLAGLASMHRHDLTHGDIKPANVFISLQHQHHASTQSPALVLAVPLAADGAGAQDTPARNGAGSRHVVSSEPVQTEVAPLIQITAAAAAAAAALAMATTLTAAVPASAASNAPLDHQQTTDDWGCISQLQGMTFKIGDFGTVRDKTRKHLSYFVQGFGYTLEYASPEALRHGTSRSGPPGDIWSVGVVIVELLLGRTPAFALKMAELADPSRHGAREKWVRQHPPHQHAMAELLDGGVTVSREMAQVIERSLQVCPQDRASQADALLQLPWFTGKEMSEDEEADEPLYSPLYSFDYMLPMAWTPWLA